MKHATKTAYLIIMAISLVLPPADMPGLGVGDAHAVREAQKTPPGARKKPRSIHERIEERYRDYMQDYGYSFPDSQSMEQCAILAKFSVKSLMAAQQKVSLEETISSIKKESSNSNLNKEFSSVLENVVKSSYRLYSDETVECDNLLSKKRDAVVVFSRLYLSFCIETAANKSKE